MTLPKFLRPAVRGAALALLLVATASPAQVDLPIDPGAVLGNLTPDQRQRAMDLLGSGSTSSLPSSDGRFRDRGLTSSDGSLRYPTTRPAGSAVLTDPAADDSDCPEDLPLPLLQPVAPPLLPSSAPRGTPGSPVQTLGPNGAASGDGSSLPGPVSGLPAGSTDPGALYGTGLSATGAGYGYTEADRQRARRIACRDARARLRGEDPIDTALDFGRKPLKPFGYDVFSAAAATTFAPATDIPVPADYVLGPGDTLRVQLFGNENGNYTLQVGRDGAINFPKLGPISVAGSRFDDARARIGERVSRELIGVQASLSLGELRSVRVFLLGDVVQPGSYTVSSLSTITNVLFVGGGVSPVGSLRRIELKRGGQLVRVLDLYDLLLRGDSGGDERVLPGDVIFVPPVGARVSIDGEVKRPAIYELHGEKSVDQALALAGGLLATTNTAGARLERYADNRKQIRQLDLAKTADLGAAVRDGDLLRVGAISTQADNRVRIAGFVKYPGPYQWQDGYPLHDLLATAEVRPSNAADEAYLALGLIERTDRASGTRNWLGFNVAAQLGADAPALPLQRDDLVVILSRDDIAYLDSQDVRDVAAGTSRQQPGQCPALDELARLVDSERSVRVLKAFNAETQRDDDGNAAPARRYARLGCPELFRRVPRALPFLLDASVALYGEVRRPGLYPVAPDTPLSLVVQSAGGLTTESDPANIEYVSYAAALGAGRSDYATVNLRDEAGKKLRVGPGDLLTFKPLYLGQEVGTVKLAGEFRFPGTYGILRGERLSQLIRRAGGITPTAYPYGAVFTRASARKAEAESYRRASKDLQEAAVTALTSGALGKDATVSSQFLTTIAAQLENAPAIGRVVIEADPVLLDAKPEFDPIVEPGDALVMPKRPISVTVIGQVLNPGSLAFRSGTSVTQYVERAGGFAQAADKGRVFVILPNGTAEKFRTSFWNFEARDVPPGSVIVVPRDAAPFNALAFGERIFGVLSSLAVTAAALATISRN